MKRPFKKFHLQHIPRPFFAFFHLPGSKTFGILLLIFVVIVWLAALDLTWNYVNPNTGQRLDPVAAFYAVFALLVFETPFPLPKSWITRLVFFAIPVSGIILLGQGLLRAGSVIFDKDAWDRAMASTYKDHTIVCGLGKVSLKIIRWILDLDEEAVVIEQHRDNPYLDEVRSWGVPVIIADARRPEVLEEVNIKYAESIVPGTNDDLVNLSIALQARQLVPNLKVVLRMSDTAMAENVRTGFDIYTTFSIPEISAPIFAAAATRAPLDHAFTYDEGGERGLLTITKFVLVKESLLVGYTVGQLEDEFDVAVVAHRQDGKFNLHPANDTVLKAGDRFIVSASIEGVNQIAEYTPPRREVDRYHRGRWPIKGSEERRVNSE